MRNSNFKRVSGARLLLAAGVIALAGCGGGGGGGSGGNGGGGGTGGGGSGTAAIDPSLTSVDFGSIVVDGSSARSFTVTNSGTASFNIGHTDPGEPFSVQRPCDSLDVGESCTIIVQFTPREQGSFSGSFDIGSQEINTTINLTGEGKDLAVLISGVEQSCPDPDLTFRVRVSDSAGNPLTVLAQSHFTTLIDGTEVDENTFGSVSVDEPVSVGLMIDWSNSLQDFRQDLIDGSTIFIDALRDESDAVTDRAGLFRFATAVDGNAVAFSDTTEAGKDALVAGLSATFDGSATPTMLWDSLTDVLGRTTAETTDNQVVVLLTDGFDDNSTASLDDVIATANASNVTVFTIGFGDIEIEELERLASETGGLFFPSPDLNDLSTIYETLLGLLSNQYEITITNPTPDADTVLEVVVVDDMAREGEDSRDVPACN